jgi:hypothetical protein
LTDDEFWASPAVQKMAGLSGQPTSTPRASRRGLANRIVDLARQVCVRWRAAVQVLLLREV